MLIAPEFFLKSRVLKGEEIMHHAADIFLHHVVSVTGSAKYLFEQLPENTLDPFDSDYFSLDVASLIRLIDQILHQNRIWFAGFVQTGMRIAACYPDPSFSEIKEDRIILKLGNGLTEIYQLVFNLLPIRNGSAGKTACIGINQNTVSAAGDNPQLRKIGA